LRPATSPSARRFFSRGVAKPCRFAKSSTVKSVLNSAPSASPPLMRLGRHVGHAKKISSSRKVSRERAAAHRDVGHEQADRARGAALAKVR
jgi:hypothetical protein